LAWVAHTLRARLAKLGGSPTAAQSPIAVKVPDPDSWNFASPEHGNEESASLVEPVSLQQLLSALTSSAYNVSDAISTTYFTHSGQTNQSLGT
jgi:hypothetical protein